MEITSLRPSVVDSWYRSAAAGVDVDTVESPITLTGDLLHHARQAHPLAQVFPLLDDILGQAARDCDALLAVSDAEGQLLWVRGSSRALRQGEQIGFVEGSNWDERMAGTNAPGLVLALGREAAVLGREHYRRSVQPWNCIAAPIHDLTTGEILGVLDITGDDCVAVPQTMAMVRAAARMAELEISHRAGRQADVPVTTTSTRSHLHLSCLGRREALVDIGDGRPVRLTPRLSDLMTVLAARPKGMAGDELAALVYADGGTTATTVRAEVNRLRALLGESVVESRPYRLAAEVATDWQVVEANLAVGSVTEALRAYQGPVLPHSTAPGVIRIRETVETDLRSAVLASGQLDLMSRWTRSAWGSDDYAMWQGQRALVPKHSPLMPLIRGQLSRLDRELGM